MTCAHHRTPCFHHATRQGRPTIPCHIINASKLKKPGLRVRVENMAGNRAGQILLATP